MAKQPRLGQVKTRLCPPLTPGEAESLYHAFLLDTVRVVQEACLLAGNVTPALAYAPIDAHDYFRAMLPAGFVLLPQRGADLGERLCNLPGQARQLGFRRAAMVSSDSPTLPPSIVARCFQELLLPDVDVALGPCADGGYYLIGLNAPQPALFKGISWSTGSVTAQTLDAARAAGLRVSLLTPWYDADTVEDLHRMWADLEADPKLAPYTRAALARVLATAEHVGS